MKVTADTLSGYITAIRNIKDYLTLLIDSPDYVLFATGDNNGGLTASQKAVLKGVLNHVETIEENYKLMFIKD